MRAVDMGKAKRKHIEQLTGDGPTEHARRNEDYRTQRVEKNGPRIAFNHNVTPLTKALAKQKITPRQKDAAEVFEKAYMATYQTPGTRDPLDMTPRGTTDETPQEWLIRMKRTCHGIMAELSKEQSMTFIAVAVFHESLGRLREDQARFNRFCEAADLAADFLGLPDKGQG